MRPETLDLLRCPYCAGRLRVVEEAFHRLERGRLIDAVLSCHCSSFPVVAGIPVMTVEGVADTARQQIEAGDADGAVLSMLAFEDEERAVSFVRLETSPAATFRSLIELLAPEWPEARYFLYRFSDPTYLVAAAAVLAIVGELGEPQRSVDVCGGAGHLTRSLVRAGSPAPLLVDFSFAKLWLARRFTAPGCEPVYADAHVSLPFASGTFGLALCSDAFHYIWSKRLLAGEMMRLAGDAGVCAVTHVHNARQTNPSAGLPLPPEGYRDLFDAMEARVFSERRLLSDVLRGRFNLSQADPGDVLDADPALTVMATRRPGLFADHPLPSVQGAGGELRINPLYRVELGEGGASLQLRFPSAEYEQEYGAARQYLPDRGTIDQDAYADVLAGRLSGAVRALLERRIVLDLPRRYL